MSRPGRDDQDQQELVRTLCKNFFVTFPKKYRSEHHPRGGHPDGWIRIVAKDHATAMKLAFKEFGESFDDMKPEDKFDKRLFPRGELRVIT